MRNMLLLIAGISASPDTKVTSSLVNASVLSKKNIRSKSKDIGLPVWLKSLEGIQFIQGVTHDKKNTNEYVFQ